MRTCKYCNRTIKGRADKIYCSAICKSKAHRKKQNPSAPIHTINKILQNNYLILYSLFTNSKAAKMKIDHLSLANRGFQFDYCTRIYLNNKGKWYRYVYDYRWMEFSDQKVIVFRS